MASRSSSSSIETLSHDLAAIRDSLTEKSLENQNMTAALGERCEAHMLSTSPPAPPFAILSFSLPLFLIE